MWPFSCTHPFRELRIQAAPKVEPIDADFELHTTRLYCQRCGEKSLEISCSHLIGGVDAFLARGEAKLGET